MYTGNSEFFGVDRFSTETSRTFSPKSSEILNRFKFNKWDQQRGESIAYFVVELRKLSEHCNFGLQLDYMLRDRLVCGKLDEDIQRKLLSDLKLTLNSALDLALVGMAALYQDTDIRGTINVQVCSTLFLIKYCRQSTLFLIMYSVFRAVLYLYCTENRVLNWAIFAWNIAISMKYSRI